MIKDVLEQRTELHPPPFFLLERAEIILEKNYFKFDRDLHLQIKGVDMGPTFAPSMAFICIWPASKTSSFAMP